MSNPNQRTVLLGAAAVMAIIVLALVVQDQRHGWPFSRHMEAASEHSNAHAAAQPAATRVPVEIPSEQIAALGVQFEPVEVQPLADSVHAVATVVADESRVSHVHTRVAGWLEELYVNTTGATVRAGQPLGAVFSQELYSSQKEYLAAVGGARGGPASAILAAARERLEVLGMSDAEIDQIERSGEARRLVTIVSPRNGIVLNRGVSAGTAIDPSTEILAIADLSYVWVIAELTEADVTQVRVGTPAKLSFAEPGRDSLSAGVEFIYPMLTEGTRTVRVRIPVPNPRGALRPGMYGTAEFPPVARDALTVARDAVVDTGESQHVFVHTAANVLEPRQVKIGARFDDRVEILQGLSPGDHVVTTGVFLIDSESRLRASGGTGHSGHGAGERRDNPVRTVVTKPDEPAQHAH